VTLTSEQHSLVHRAFLAGDSIATLAARYRVSTDQVEQWIRTAPRYVYKRKTNGEWLRARRIAAGLTLIEMAKRSGFSKSHLSAVEINRRGCTEWLEHAYASLPEAAAIDAELDARANAMMGRA
jgi:hypothetical protein